MAAPDPDLTADNPSGSMTSLYAAAQIVARSQDNSVRYTFADPYKCRCVYVGGSKSTPPISAW